MWGDVAQRRVLHNYTPAETLFVYTREGEFLYAVETPFNGIAKKLMPERRIEPTAEQEEQLKKRAKEIWNHE
jgi:hypothetical protein